MRRNGLIILFIFVFTAMCVVDAFLNQLTSNETGAPAARTGSPGDGFISCTDCHLGPSPAFMSGWITSSIPSSGYVPGNSYTITATITRPGHVRYGFEVSPQDLTGAQLGTLLLTNVSETKLVGSGKYITHTFTGTSGSGSKSWSFDWQAPGQGSGEVVFYGAFNAANNQSNSSGDTIFLSTLTVNECSVPSQPGTITGNATACAGSNQTYRIQSVPDATAYLWNLPSGWTGTSSDTSISVTVGNSGGAISVNAVNDCGVGVARVITVALSNPSVTFTNINQVSCSGGTNGSATAVPAGGQQPYTASWNTNPVQTGLTATGLAAGTYTVSITDAVLCVTTSQVVITQPAALSISANSLHVSCAGQSNGMARVNVLSGGTSPFTYSWNTTPVQNNDTAFNLAAGTYTATVTDSKGCTKTSSVTIAQPPAMTLTTSTSAVSCNGGTNGSATLNVAGGTIPITYSWNSSPTQTTATATGLPAGTYIATATDNNGCTKTASVSVIQPLAITASASGNNVSCHGGTNGSASVTASGGSGLLTYSWNTVPVQTTTIATNLAAGSYTVIVKDANNCTKSATTVISEPVQILLQTGATNASCSLATGTAFVDVSGGTPGYTYAWNTNPVQTNDTIVNLQAGSYMVTVTDATGCTAQAFATVINSSGVMLGAGTINNILCNGDSTGSASVVASGGTTPYTYSWQPSGNTTSNLSNAIAGSYNVTVTDANNCLASVIVTINQPPPLIATAGQDVVLCEGDSVQLGSNPTAFGGIAPYNYVWNPDTGLDDDSSTNPYAHPQTTVTYQLLVTDSNGCEAGEGVTVTVQSAPSIPTVAMMNDTLYSSAAAFYQWYENGTIINGADSSYYVPTHASNYSVQITDSNGCMSESAEFSFVLGVTTLTSSIHVSLFPNPAGDYLVLKCNSELPSAIVTFYDITSTRVLSATFKEGLNKLDISRLPPGVYMVRLENEHLAGSAILFIAR